jgi:hypothetical protein
MTAVNDFIANLKNFRSSADSSPMIGDIDLFIAALSELATGSVPTGTSALTSQGRLTLTSGVPVLTSDVTGAGTTFFTPYNGNNISIFNGSLFVPQSFAEVSQTLADPTKSPSAGAANKNYDLFAWLDGATFRCTRGPAWASDTARGAGAGTTELTRLGGVLVNVAPITNGPGANLGTYVSSIRTDAAIKCNMMFQPAEAAGGSVNRLDVWNMYNRAMVSSVNRDSTASWVYALAVYRAKNNSAGNETSFICGIQEDMFSAFNTMNAANSATAAVMIAWGLDSTSVLEPSSDGYEIHTMSASGRATSGGCLFTQMAPLGFHFVCPLEIVEANGNTTYQNKVTAVGVDIRNSTRFQFPM